MIYSVLLNSRKPYRQNGSNSSVTYAQDWSFLPQDKHFRVSFSFHSTSDGQLNADSLFYVTADFTGSPVNYYANAPETPTATSQRSLLNVSNIIGVIHSESSGPNNQNLVLRVNADDNYKITLLNRPNNTFFTINLVKYDEATFNLNAHYLMMLYFEEVRN